jgi:4-hydroxythreonine-4-phosphate dehydrogenase
MGYLSNTADKPVIGISLGDFNGIGPEVILKTLQDTRILKICTPVVYGSYKIMAKYKKLLNIPDEVSFNSVRAIDQLHLKKNNIITCWEEDYEINPGKITTEAGKCAYVSLDKAAEDVAAGKIDAIVTAPINKNNIQSEEFKFPGHTEFLTEKCGVKDSLMLLVNGELRVGVVTGHIPLSVVKEQLTKERLLSKINVLYKTLKNDFSILKPKIAVLGLNPHAGEQGLLGKEEQEMIIPLLEELKSKGVLVFGPFSADGFFGMHQYKKFDGVIAMYHDQGLIPFKTIAFETGVNYTAGLPIVRTSPDHGTAYDIAGKNLANESSFREAMYLACDIVKSRKPVLMQ